METTIHEISSAIETLAESMEFDELDDNDFGDVLQGDQKLEEVFDVWMLTKLWKAIQMQRRRS